ncbi:MAG: hypothetical protein HYV09_39195 [Deltaproteobacteria bacterium]|nr:hypothetical protein [Deltaproteobacteria bacterium]
MRRVSIVGGLFLISVGCTVGHADSREGDLGTQSQAMNCGGAPDTSNALDFAPYLVTPKGVCTAVLVTPVWRSPQIIA